MTGLVGVVVGLAACFVVAALVGLLAVAARRQWLPLAGTHAHNDYRQRHPLLDALRYGFVSVEADVWPVEGQLLVAHDAADADRRNTLRRLYLEPLRLRIAEHGMVQPGQPLPFQQLVEIKTDPDTSYRLIAAELRDYADMLTRYERDRIVPGGVSVILSGKCPRELLAAEEVRYAACDGSFADLGDEVPASLVPLISEKLAWRFTWRGRGPMPPDEREKLHRLVAQAHDEGRIVRFWGVPTSPWWVRREVWRELHEAGVDYLGADRLRTLIRYLRRLERHDRRLAGGPRQVAAAAPE